MKVLYLHQHFCSKSGTSGTRSYEFAKALIEQGHSVTMICGSSSDTGLQGKGNGRYRRGEVDGIEVIERLVPYTNHFGFLRRTFAFLNFAIFATKMALTENFDLLFATSTPLTIGIPAIICKVLRRKPFVFEVRDLWPAIPKEMKVIENPIILWLMSLLEGLSYRSADAIIGLSPGMVDGVKDHPWTKAPVTLIPNGCDTQLFSPTTKKPPALPGIQPQSFTAVFAGAHGIANGLSAIVDAAVVLKQKGREDIQLVFIGDGKQKASLQERVAKEQLNNCLFLPPIAKDHLSQILPQFHVGLMILANMKTFYYGTSPNKFFDYISSGLPVITNYPGWVADLVTQHECGSFAPPENAHAFAQALIDLADHTLRREQFGKNARMLATQKFSRTKLSQDFVKVLEETYSPSSLPKDTDLLISANE